MRRCECYRCGCIWFMEHSEVVEKRYGDLKCPECGSLDFWIQNPCWMDRAGGPEARA